MLGLAITKRGPNGDVHCGESLGGLLGEGLEALSLGVEAVELEVCLDKSGPGSCPSVSLSSRPSAVSPGMILPQPLTHLLKLRPAEGEERARDDSRG